MPDMTIPTTPHGWPLLDDDNYLVAIPPYTNQLATKLENSEAAVARAENAAVRAENAATKLAAYPAIAHGSTRMVPGAAVTVTLPTGMFDTAPNVTTNIRSGAGATSAYSSRCYQTSTTDIRLIVHGTGTTPVDVDWIAIGTGATA